MGLHIKQTPCRAGSCFRGGESRRRKAECRKQEAEGRKQETVNNVQVTVTCVLFTDEPFPFCSRFALMTKVNKDPPEVLVVLLHPVVQALDMGLVEKAQDALL